MGVVPVISTWHLALEFLHDKTHHQWLEFGSRHLGFPGGSAGKEFTCSAGDRGSIPEWGRSPREGKGNPLRLSRQQEQGQGWRGMSLSCFFMVKAKQNTLASWDFKNSRNILGNEVPNLLRLCRLQCMFQHFQLLKYNLLYKYMLLISCFEGQNLFFLKLSGVNLYFARFK